MEKKDRFCPYAGHTVSCNLDTQYCKRCSAYLEKTEDHVPVWKQNKMSENYRKGV